MGDEVRVTVIAAGFDRWDEQKEGKSREASVAKAVRQAATATAEPSAPAGEAPKRRHPLEPDDVFADTEDDLDIEGDDDFDVPEFLK
jgi:cell division protein FtsZ